MILGLAYEFFKMQLQNSKANISLLDFMVPLVHAKFLIDLSPPAILYNVPLHCAFCIRFFATLVKKKERG